MAPRSRAGRGHHRHAADRRVGLLFRAPVFDYAYGLPDRQVARLVSAQKRRFDTPTDSALAAIWRARSPEYVLEDGPIIDYIASQSGGTRQRFSIHGIEYRLVEQFTIGHDAQWVLARRVAPTVVNAAAP